MKEHNRKSGMTLVEMVVFMTLTLFLMGSMISVLQQTHRIDAASEERFSAFFAGQSTLEELQSFSLKELTERPDFVEKNEGQWYRRATNVIFHTKGGFKPTPMTAKEIVRLVPGRTGNAPHIYASVTLKWNSGSFGGTHTIKETVSTILFDKE